MARSEDLRRAAAAASGCGVTRIGDITRLDTLGVQVWQTFRPWSRALSVHVGKGLTEEAAQMGALMEAVESAYAEDFHSPGQEAPFEALPPDERPPHLADFATSRADPPPEEASIAWVAAERISGGGLLWAPVIAVSLDCTERGDPRLERSSNGLAARFSREEASAIALLELIERDALAAWRGMTAAGRAQTELELASVPFPWFRDLCGRIVAAGVRVSVHQLPTVTALPAFVCQLIEPRERRISARAYGSAAHPRPETALQKAVLEAVQSRLTFIAGARDDAYFPVDEGLSFGFAMPLPPGLPLLDWEQLRAPPVQARAATAEVLARGLSDAGYPDAAIVELTPPGSDVVVIKAFCPGLGAYTRRRRGPAGR